MLMKNLSQLANFLITFFFPTAIACRLIPYLPACTVDGYAVKLVGAYAVIVQNILAPSDSNELEDTGNRVVSSVDGESIQYIIN